MDNSRGYKYSLHALIDMSIKYLNISKKNMEIRNILKKKHIQDLYLAMALKFVEKLVV